MATKIVLNAKTQRPSVCNAAESLLLHKDFFNEHGEAFLATLSDAGIKIYGDDNVCSVLPTALKATEEHLCRRVFRLNIKCESC